jgi:anti-sigma factor RsiW
MSTNTDHLQELLNGLLDGVLSDEEQRALDLAMRVDPSLETKLAEMQSMRRSLLRGRSVGRLGPNFAKQVVAESKKRAESMGDDAPQWLHSSNRNSAEQSEGATETTTLATSLSRRAWRVWIPMLAAATAASLVLYFAGPFSSQPLVQPLVGERTPTMAPRLGEDRSGVEAEEQEANRMAVDLLANGARPSESAGNQATTGIEESMAESSVGIDEADGKRPEQRGSDHQEKDLRIANDGSAESKGNLDNKVVSNSMTGSQASDPVRDILDANGVTNPVYTMVVEVAVDPVAEQSDALRTLLEEHEIVYADDLNMSREQLDSLVSSQMIGKMSGIDSEKRSDDVQVMFVRAKAKRIDSFLMEVVAQYRDFPKFRMDLSYDPAVLKLMKQLNSISSGDDGARRLTFRGSSDSGLVSLFPAASGKGEFLDVEMRKRLLEKKGVKKSSREETSYLILLVRSTSTER